MVAKPDREFASQWLELVRLRRVAANPIEMLLQRQMSASTRRLVNSEIRLLSMR